MKEKKSTMRRLIISSFMCMLTASGYGQQINVNEAMNIAATYLKGQCSASKGTQNDTESTKLSLAYTDTRSSDQKVCFYVFNRNENDGFIIVGGDKVAKQILAISDEGSFDYDSAPDNFKWWLSIYSEQISTAIDAEAKSMANSTTTARNSISPLLTTKWSQNKPFNTAVTEAFRLQTGKSVDLATGCVATAMAQIMYYFKYPEKGTGTATGTTRKYNVDGSLYTFTPSADFSNTTYDWGNMQEDYNSYNTTSANAVATLMYHAGVAVDMHYASSSSATFGDISTALISNFGYDKSMRTEKRDYFNDEDWENIIYKELANGRPVLYSGVTKMNNGHAFICDGYRASDNTFHINWGWGGMYDCYCPMKGTSALVYGGSGSEEAYTNSQSIIINVKPDEGGLVSPILRTYNTPELYDGTETYATYTYTHGVKADMKLLESVSNTGSTSYTLGVKATDNITGAEYYWECSNPTTINGKKALDFDPNDLKYNGTYTIRAVGRNANSTSDDDWFDVEGSSSITYPTLTIEGAEDGEKQDVTFTISSTIIQAGRTAQISTNSSYIGTTTYQSSNPEVATVDENGMVTGISAGSAVITAKANGNSNYHATEKNINIAVTNSVKNDAEISIDATVLAIGMTAQITLPSDYTGKATYSPSNKKILFIDSNGLVTAKLAGNATITVTLPATDIYNAKTEELSVEVSKSTWLFYKEPYITNDNNMWEGDMTVHLPLYNGTGNKFSGNYVLKYKVGGYSGKLTGTVSNLPTGKNDLTVDMGSYINIYKQYKGHSFSIDFFTDENCNSPFNIPSLTYTFRGTENIDLEMTSSGYQTIILPFNAELPVATNSDKPVDWKAYECKELDDETIILSQVTTLKRNIPYIITGTITGKYTFTGPEAVNGSPILFGDGPLKGTMLSKYKYTTNDYILQDKDNKTAFYQFDSSKDAASATPYKAFIQSDGLNTYYAMPGSTGTNDIADNITKSLTSSSVPSGIYSINGIHQDKLQPGLNIIIFKDGKSKKFFVKK